MIVDTVPDLGLKRRYLAYDLMSINSQSVVKVDMLHMLSLIGDAILWSSQLTLLI